MNKNGMAAENCIHCGKCTRNCSFLSKYKIDIGNIEKLQELAYHCFLCGKCSEVCPVGIDGRGIILNMRQEMVEKAGKVPEKGYDMLLLEKKNYLFRNYRHGQTDCRNGKQNVSAEEISDGGKSVFFPGCNFSSFYPETTKKLIAILKENEIGVVFDCCGKPVAELGLKEQEEKIITDMEERLKQSGITELIMACPNCYHFLKPRLKGISIISIYEKLWELGIGKEIEGDISVFLPCPDRKQKELLEKIEPFVAGEFKIITEVSCCGLGGCAAAKEPDLSKGMAGALKQAGYEIIHTYCGSCAGNLARNGYKSNACSGNVSSGNSCSGDSCLEVKHILAEILETEEKPDISHSFINRVKTKFI